MLTCIFHPLDPMRVTEDDEAQRLIESGVWFDCPNKAKKYRKKVEDDIKNEAKVEEAVEPKESKAEKTKAKTKEKANER